MKIENLISVYPFAGIENFIEAVKRVFKDNDEQFWSRFINRTISHSANKIDDRALCISFLVGLSRHHYNIAKSYSSRREWTMYLMHHGIGAKYQAIVGELIYIEGEQMGKPEIEKHQTFQSFIKKIPC
jgi:hypothetical protein